MTDRPHPSPSPSGASLRDVIAEMRAEAAEQARRRNSTGLKPVELRDTLERWADALDALLAESSPAQTEPAQWRKDARERGEQLMQAMRRSLVNTAPIGSGGTLLRTRAEGNDVLEWSNQVAILTATAGASEPSPLPSPRPEALAELLKALEKWGEVIKHGATFPEDREPINPWAEQQKRLYDDACETTIRVLAALQSSPAHAPESQEKK